MHEYTRKVNTIRSFSPNFVAAANAESSLNHIRFILYNIYSLNYRNTE